jgi:hypothetical protein
LAEASPPQPVQRELRRQHLDLALVGVMLVAGVVQHVHHVVLPEQQLVQQRGSPTNVPVAMSHINS